MSIRLSDAHPMIPAVPQITDTRSLKLWRVRGRTWLDTKTGGTEREVIVATDHSAPAEEAIRLGHAALASLEPAHPARVEVDGVEAGGRVFLWGERREF
jgi:hypothetical protein